MLARAHVIGVTIDANDKSEVDHALTTQRSAERVDNSGTGGLPTEAVLSLEPDHVKAALDRAEIPYVLGRRNRYEGDATVATRDPSTGELRHLGMISVRGNHNYPTFSTRIGNRFVIQGNGDPVINVLNTEDNTLEQLPPPPTPVISAVQANVGGKFWLVGGYTYQTPQYPAGYAAKIIQQWDFDQREWSVVGELPYDITTYDAHAARVGDRAAVVDGRRGRPNLELVP